MGYKREPKQYRLKFMEGDMRGFECLMGALSVDEFIEITTLASKLSGNPEREEVIKLFSVMAGHIISWNLENDDDTPVPTRYAVCRKSGRDGDPGHACPEHFPEEGEEEVPCEYDGICAQEFDFVMAIQMSWMDAMAKVPGPLPDSSDNGGRTQTALTQSLGDLSRNLPS